MDAVLGSVRRASLRLLIVGAVTLVATLLFVGSVQAASQNVLLVPNAGGAGSGPGSLPTSGFPDGYAPSFSTASTAWLAEGSEPNPLTGKDTLVLVGVCDLQELWGDSDFSGRISEFVSGGGKLLIWANGCEGAYPSFLVPFDARYNGYESCGFDESPQRLFFYGTCEAKVVENNTLSSNESGSATQVDIDLVTSDTNAIADSSTFGTDDPRWCNDILAHHREFGFLERTQTWDETGFHVYGAVQAYASYGSGLIVFNGMAITSMGSGLELSSPRTAFDGSGSGELEKLWLYQLKQPVNPNGLPCSRVATGLTLSVAPAAVQVGQQIQVTGVLRDDWDIVVPNQPVSFEAYLGATLVGEAEAVTDAAGIAKFTYTPTVAGTYSFKGHHELRELQVLSRAATQASLYSNTVIATATEPVATVVTQTQSDTAVAADPITADTVRPKARISARISKCVWKALRVKVAASDASGVASVDFSIDDEKIAVDTTPAFEALLSVRGLSRGKHVLTIRARDKAGNVTVTSKRFRHCVNPARVQRRAQPRFTG